jgi:DNA (cytosine-5)-methyltransferase 3A
LEGEHSKLFWEWVRIWKESKPKYFILENVASMPAKDRDIISAELGVQPIMINASLVSAQNRKRLFWTNIPVVGLPVDRGIALKDILEPDVEGSITQTFTASKSKSSGAGLVQIGHIGNSNGQANRVYSDEGKSVTLSANGGGLGAKTGLYKTEYSKIRKLTPVECERLQSLPDNYTAGISNTQRYRCLGNAFNCEVIKFIISFMPEN